MIDLTPKEMIKAILRSLEETAQDITPDKPRKSRHKPARARLSERRQNPRLPKSAAIRRRPKD